MKTLFPELKYVVVILLLTITITTQAQHGPHRIGNKPRTGSANSSYDLKKGNQVGVKMNIGHKTSQLLQFNFDVENLNADSLKFKVNIYSFNDEMPGGKLFTQEIYGAAGKGKQYVTVDLQPYNLQAKGTVLVAIEMLKDYNGDNHFPIGLFNGGTWRYANDHWKKMAVAGVDFNMLVRKI